MSSKYWAWYNWAAIVTRGLAGTSDNRVQCQYCSNMPPDTTRECLLSSPGSVSKSWKVGGRSQRMVGTGHQLTLDQYVWQWGHVETPTTHCTDTSSSPQLMFTVFCSHSKKHLLSYLTQDAKAYIFTQIFLGIRLKYF